jgi:hypothetical protein
MSYAFWCSNCKKDHAGECPPKGPQWRWTTNYSLPLTEERKTGLVGKWLNQFHVPGDQVIHFKFGHALENNTIPACTDEEMGPPAGNQGGFWIDYDSWIAWQMSVNGGDRARAMYRAVVRGLI